MQRRSTGKLIVGILGAPLLVGLLWVAISRVQPPQAGPSANWAEAPTEKDRVARPGNAESAVTAFSEPGPPVATSFQPLIETSSDNEKPAETADTWRPKAALSGKAILLTTPGVCACLAGGVKTLERRFEQAVKQCPEFVLTRIDAAKQPAEAASVLKEHRLIAAPGFVLLDGNGTPVIASDIRDPQFEDCCALAIRWLSAERDNER